ncbi:cytidylyltransferase domain-containing protein [Microbacterium sp.]|uniref:cytidylyltransferase domain-containing protein n=1 Tax=Microbacterium sp. TaxID=51671 RepID=UPI003A925142
MRIAVIQARMGSQRLPGKVLADLGGRPILEHVVARLRRASTVDVVVVATSTAPTDDELQSFCEAYGVDVVRGDQFDVLERFGQVLDLYPEADEVIRVTADCPFIDPDVVDEVVNALSDADYATNRLPPPHPRTYPVGLDVEVASRSALLRARSEATAPVDREHVMPFLYAVPGRFKVRVLDLDEDLSRHRWTVDTPEDLAVVRALYAKLLGEPFGWREVLEIARKNPTLEVLNSAIRQKSLDVVDSRWEGAVSAEPPASDRKK